MTEEPKDILKKYWGHTAFRYSQEAVINSVLDRKNTLAIMPTGAGKSLCYQIPALATKGMGVVISPLIALMIDQVDKLNSKGISAAYIHSGMPKYKIKSVLNESINGHIKILYISPERLISPSFKDYLANLPVSMLAVDEAHCICEWGYDFRPAYLEIAVAHKQLNNTTILALTASATPSVQRDIQKKLGFENSNIILSPLKRENISYHVIHTLNKEEKLIGICKAMRGSGIIYLNSRRGVERVNYILRNARISSNYYHAGLEMTQRHQIQEDWITANTRIIVATNAFGMGIDKSDVRFVLHTQLPMSLESYYQESGRAGRDGKKSYAILLHNQKDKITLTRQFESSYPSILDIRLTYKNLAIYFDQAVGSLSDTFFDFSYDDFLANSSLNKTQAFHSIKQLISDGWIHITDYPIQVSKVKFIIGKEILYDLQIKNRKFETFSKTLLRTYEGLFSEYVPISEKEIGKKLDITPALVSTYLQKMHTENIIIYQASKSNPQLSFLKSRVKSTDLELNEAKISFRKNRHLSRINSVVQYVEHTACREVFVLNYFGEENNDFCGHCDLCIKREKSANKVRIKEIDKMITSFLDKNQLSLKNLLNKFPASDHKWVIDHLSSLEQENVIKIEGDIITRHNHMT